MVLKYGAHHQPWVKVLRLKKDILGLWLIQNQNSPANQSPKNSKFYHSHLFIFKCIVLLQKHFLTIQQSEHQHNYTFRDKMNLQYPRHRLTMVEKSPQYMGRKLFTKLPADLKSCINYQNFKSKLFNFLLDKNIHSINDFLQAHD